MRKKKKDDVLAELLGIASSKVLADFIYERASIRPDVRRECFDHLKKHSALSEVQRKRSEGETVLALWCELAPDLHDLDDYGGGDYSLSDHVSSLLYDIEKRLTGKKVDAECRRSLLVYLLPYIKSGNAGLDDDLYMVAYAACYSDSDLRLLAEAFEEMGKGWNIEHARRIYRQLGDKGKYLELRQKKMEYGGDYHDLAEFYWETGEKERALQVAE